MLELTFLKIEFDTENKNASSRRKIRSYFLSVDKSESDFLIIFRCVIKARVTRTWSVTAATTDLRSIEVSVDISKRGNVCLNYLLFYYVGQSFR
jgi:hypothetical protein